MALHDITLQHITNTFNGKVTVQKNEKYVLSTHVTTVQSPKAEPTSWSSIDLACTPLACEQALHLIWRGKRSVRERASGRTRDFIHVLLSRDFSQLSQMESLLEGQHSLTFG